MKPSPWTPDRRAVLSSAVALPVLSGPLRAARRRAAGPLLVGSANALPGMEAALRALEAGGHPLDAALDVVSRVEADPDDTSVGLGGLPNEDGEVQLDAACMDGATHNSGAVAALENVVHAARVARLVMERTDHCLLVGDGAYRFARAHGFPHEELLTERAREIWLRWKETMSGIDDRLPPPEPAPPESKGKSGAKTGRVDFAADPDAALAALDPARGARPHHGTVHCSALSAAGAVACTTTTSGLPFKLPGRVGDSPIVGAGLYCDADVGSAGGTGRGESAVLANASFAVVELMRGGAHPRDAGLEVLRRVTLQARRQARWQPALVDEDGVPAFGLHLYCLDLSGRFAGVTLSGSAKYAVADGDGARLEPLVALHER